MIKKEITTKPIDLALMTGNYEINSEKMREIKTNNHKLSQIH